MAGPPETLKVGFVCPLDFSRRGGIQGCVENLATSLRRMGHQAAIIASGPPTPPHPGVSAFGSFRAFVVNGTTTELTGAGVAEVRRLRRFLREWDFDVLHYHHLWNPFFGFQVALTREARRCPGVLTYHDTPPSTPLGRLLATVVMPLASGAINRLFMDRVTTVSSAPYRHLRYFDRDARIIPNGVLVDDYAPGRVSPHGRLRDGKVNVLYVGRLDPRKGVLHLVDAFKRLKDAGRDARLVIVGDGGMRGEIEARVRTLALGDVEFAGDVSEEDKRRHYASCDVAVFPSPGGESMGIVLVEAMASGKPALAAANAGYSTVLAGQAETLLFTPGDVQDLSAKLLRLVDDPALRSALGQWGIVEARRYDSDGVAREMERVYREAIEERRRG